jgi:preprotein translocase subunit SecA
MVVAAIAKRIFGSANEPAVRRYQPKVDAINAIEPEFQELTDEQLKAKAEELKQAYKPGSLPARSTRT